MVAEIARQVDDLHPPVAVMDGARDVEAVIRRAVIDQDDLEGKADRIRNAACLGINRSIYCRLR